MKLSRRAFVGAAAAPRWPGLRSWPRPSRWCSAACPANSVHWIACAAVERGFFKNVGFDAEIATIQSSPQSMQMLITGAYQISSTQPEAAIAAIERGASRLAAISAPMNRADWVLAGAAGIKSLADLKGKIIGVSSLRISEVWLTAQLLEQAGLKKDEYSFIGVGTSPLKVTALQKGSIARRGAVSPVRRSGAQGGLRRSGALQRPARLPDRALHHQPGLGRQGRRRQARRAGDPGRPSLAVGRRRTRTPRSRSWPNTPSASRRSAPRSTTIIS